MCRLFGEIAFGPQKSDLPVFEQLLRLSKPGGPDATRIVDDGVCRMGFNRLAILDLSEKANQPMYSPSKRYLVSFNGEVYNHNALRKLCDDKPYVGTSDTETLTHCFDKFGVENTIYQLDGMFAIAVWDTLEATLYLCRDFARIKPLFYAMNANGVVFSSQYNQLALHQWFSDESINPEALAAYLKRHYLPSPYGLHHHTYQVEPGQIVRITSIPGEVTKKYYWRLPVNCEETIYRPEEALDLLDTELRNAVKAEMLSDVPLGTFLSGGVDSPLISYYAAGESAQRLNTFTIGSDSAIHDESQPAAFYAEALQSLNSLYKMTDNANTAMLFNEASKALCEPFADFSMIPTYLVSKLAKTRVTVALSGDGADELFYGYERFWSIGKNLGKYDYPYWMRYGLYGMDKVLYKNKHINSAVLKTQGNSHAGLHSRFSDDLLRKVAPDLNRYTTMVDPVYQYPNCINEKELMQRMRYAEFYDMMQKTLRKVDLAGMANGLEVRVPFLKKNVIETSLACSYLLSYGKGKKKELLKALLRTKYSNPPVDNVKRGFSVPLSKWISGCLKNEFTVVLSDKALLDNYGFSQREVMQCLMDHTQGVKDNKWPLFTIYSLLKWQESLK